MNNLKPFANLHINKMLKMQKCTYKFSKHNLNFITWDILRRNKEYVENTH